MPNDSNIYKVIVEGLYPKNDAIVQESLVKIEMVFIPKPYVPTLIGRTAKYSDEKPYDGGVEVL
ncbi:MAG: hypothetical protein K0B02_05150 [DPANN group archaeon]|nr:hypothetical protein [DPANN group archaeon]